MKIYLVHNKHNLRSGWPEGPRYSWVGNSCSLVRLRHRFSILESAYFIFSSRMYRSHVNPWFAADFDEGESFCYDKNFI